jgi:hypothetical protein
VTTLADLPMHDGQESPATANGARGRKPCSRHEWWMPPVIGPDAAEWDHGIHGRVCRRCRKPYSEITSRRGRSSDRLGKDQERRIERVYGPRKVGEFGDAVDHLGRDWKWQSKATRKLPPKWLAAITEPTWRAMVPRSILDPMAHMTGLGGTRLPLVIRSYVHVGVSTRDWLFVVGVDWFCLHGTASLPGFGGFVIPGGIFGYVVIPGADFLAIHGRDEPSGDAA